jgi:general secretion pathway protein F
VAQFNYTAYDSAGQQIAGRIEAASRDAALRNLTSQGHFPIDAVEISVGAAAAGNSAAGTTRKPNATEVTLFLQELSLLLVSGQTLTGALALIEQDTSAPRIQALARRLRIAISGGKSFNESLAEEGGAFPPVCVGMVKAAEAAGNLDSVLNLIAVTREKEQKLRSRFLSSLLYPALLVVMAILTVVLMVVVVVPQFKDTLSERAAELPAGTVAVLAASDWLTKNGFELLIGICVGIGVLVLLLRREAGRLALERVLLATPLVGSVMQLSLTARFCRTLGVLLSSGLGLPASLALTRDVIGNEQARGIIQRIGVSLREGEDFTEPLRQSSVFPPLVTSLLRIGAESGSLAVASLRLADIYETKLDFALQRLLTVLEPAIILLVSVFIGFIVLSIMGAIVGVYELTGV